MNWEKHFRGPKPYCVSDASSAVTYKLGFGAILLADNLTAINDYFHRIPPATPQAQQLASDWSNWWITTGDPDNYWFKIPQTVYDEARNRRLAFDLANAVTPEQKTQVQEVATGGVSSEQASGTPDRRDPVTGQYFVPPKPPIPAWFWPVVGAGIAVVVVGPFVRKLILPI